MEFNIPNRSSPGLSLIAGVFPLELPLYAQNVTKLDIHHEVRLLTMFKSLSSNIRS